MTPRWSTRAEVAVLVAAVVWVWVLLAWNVWGKS